MRLLFAPLLMLSFVFVSCDVPDSSVMQLQEDNTLLQAKNDSLLQVIQQLRETPDEVVASVRQLMAVGKKDSAIWVLQDMKKRSLSAGNAVAIARLLKQQQKRGKENKTVLPAISQPKANDEDASLYTPNIDDKGLHANDKAEQKWSVETTKPVVKHPVQEKTYSVRVGAICRDGTRSSATGRGACSHHGGVSEWVYK